MPQELSPPAVTSPRFVQVVPAKLPPSASISPLELGLPGPLLHAEALSKVHVRLVVPSLELHVINPACACAVLSTNRANPINNFFMYCPTRILTT
jgi:hypothetical protein